MLPLKRKFFSHTHLHRRWHNINRTCCLTTILSEDFRYKKFVEQEFDANKKEFDVNKRCFVNKFSIQSKYMLEIKGKDL